MDDSWDEGISEEIKRLNEDMTEQNEKEKLETNKEKQLQNIRFWVSIIISTATLIVSIVALLK